MSFQWTHKDSEKDSKNSCTSLGKNRASWSGFVLWMKWLKWGEEEIERMYSVHRFPQWDLQESLSSIDWFMDRRLRNDIIYTNTQQFHFGWNVHGDCVDGWGILFWCFWDSGVVIQSQYSQACRTSSVRTCCSWATVELNRAVKSG